MSLAPNERLELFGKALHTTEEVLFVEDNDNNPQVIQLGRGSSVAVRMDT